MIPTGAQRPFSPCLLGNPVCPPPGVCSGMAGWCDAGECREGQRGTSARQESPDVWKMPLKETDAGVLTKRSQEGFHSDGLPREEDGCTATERQPAGHAALGPLIVSQTLGSLSSQGCLQAAGAPEAVCPPSKMLANPRPLGALSPTTTQAPGLPLGESSGLSLRELGAPGLNPTGSGPPLFPQCSPFLWACSGLLPPLCPQDRVESGCGHDKEMRSRVKKRKRQALLRNANKIYNEISPHTCHNGHDFKNLQTISAGEGMEKREPFCTLGGNVS